MLWLALALTAFGSGCIGFLLGVVLSATRHMED